MPAHMSLAKQLQSLNACYDAIAWVGRRRSGRCAWLACERGDWLLWLAARVGVDRRLIVLAACDCAEHALVHVPPGEDRPARAIATARAWAAGNATLDDVRRAAYAAHYAAAYTAANAAHSAYYAGNAAGNAAAAAAAAASAAAVAASAAYAAAYAAAAAAGARRDTLKHCADLVRARITWDEIECLLT